MEVYMSDRSNLEIVKEGYEKFGSGDIEGLLSLFSDNIQWSTPEVEGASHGGRRNGKQETAEFFSELGEAEEITLMEPVEFIDGGDRIVVLGKIQATVRSTGRSYESNWVHIFSVLDGKIAGFEEFFDTAAVNKAFEKASAA
jgi:uncharacterized protein